MTDVIPHGTSETHDGAWLLRYELHLPHPQERVWTAVATPEGLRGWLCAVDVLEPRLGGAVTLRWLNAGPEGVHSGHVTAWAPETAAEYTVDLHGRIRFHLESVSPSATVLRFTNEFAGDDALRLDCLAGWHDHFDILADALSGRPKDWSTWSAGRWQELRAAYAGG
ncbi:SRPBCC domain-containing protein [Streptomyces melanogenes]|uniref:SRPBCC domain-containing protein n=1 Tax=Streptomyces melanogenes TaxID=67326 RepID=UPI00378D0C87